ncbi:uncharacterized protein LOC130666697 [Microplitis mediator]|uniref:uncharacterized protein LOC130666697 n=1 Tax=Microplitis mediator TaxID=375433 RepID=UPI0025574DDF|nr:uncharacterized protein LOC130666697 [Microplitis mediator]
MGPLKMAGSIVLLLATLHLSRALVGFDCGGSSMNTSTLSLLDVGDCKLSNRPLQNEKVNIYLLQPAEIIHVHVIECKILINRHIQYCGWHSYSSAVLYGRREYYLEIDYNKCKRMHETNSVWLFDRVPFYDLKMNHTSHRTAQLAGSQSMGGDCTTGTYSDEYGTWSNVVVDALFEITISEYETSLNTKTNQVLLRSGTRCDAEKLTCITSEGMSAFWSEVPKDSCLMKYAQLYQGPATRIIGEDNFPDVYSLTTEDITFALAQKGTLEVCGHNVIKTEHPKLFIVVVKNAGFTLSVETIKTEDMDIFAYINSKFVYVEKFIRQQLHNLYHDVLIKRCELERAVLMNALALSSLTPDEFGYALMKGPGYYTTVAGELVHITKCVASPVRVRETEQCYQELPVTYNNKSYFLTPKSRILVQRGTLIECNTILPVGYFIDGVWFHITPQAIRAPSPQQLQPLTAPTWNYDNPEHLATSGIYSQKDLEKLRNRIMFPAEKPALLNALAMGAAGRVIPAGSVNVLGLFDEEALEKLATSTGERIWRSLVDFGSVTAGILSIMLLLRLFKFVVDTIFHGYALYCIHGCSALLLTAIWDTLANLILHHHHHRRRQSDEENQVIPPIPRARSILNIIDENSDGQISAPPKEWSFKNLSKQLGHQQLEDQQQEDQARTCLSRETLYRLRNRDP